MNLAVAIFNTLLQLSLREMITKQRLMLFDLMSSGSVICCVDVRRVVKILRALSGHDIAFLSSMMHMRIMIMSI